MAFHDLTGSGTVVARAYRLTFGQLSDLVSQESRHPVGLRPGRGRPRWRLAHAVGGLRDAGAPRRAHRAADAHAHESPAARRGGPVGGVPPHHPARAPRGRRAGRRSAGRRTSLEARGVTPRWTRAELVALCDEVQRTASAAPDPQHRGVHARRRREGLPRDEPADLEAVPPGVPRARRCRAPAGAPRRAGARGRPRAAGRCPAGPRPAPWTAGTAGWRRPGTGASAVSGHAGRCGPRPPGRRTVPAASSPGRGAAPPRPPERRRRAADQ